MTDNMEETFTFTVTFKGTLINIENWPAEATIHQLKEHLEQVTGVPADLQKLMYKALLKNDATLRASNFKPGIKIMLIGSSVKDIQAIHEADTKLSRAPSNLARSKYAVNPYKINKPVMSATSYTFQRIEVINEFPNPEKAHALLERLRDDRGIRAIMEYHKWSVGALTELSPFERTIRGYNVNAGQLISLRLRTDDLEGFWPYLDIRRVLLHELAHNVWTEHDENFHRLNRELNKEVVELDWTQSEGHKLGNAEYYNPSEVDQHSYQGGTFKLGGNVEVTKVMSRREVLAEAAVLRLTQQEKDDDQACGSRKH